MTKYSALIEGMKEDRRGLVDVLEMNMSHSTNAEYVEQIQRIAMMQLAISAVQAVSTEVADKLGQTKE